MLLVEDNPEVANASTGLLEQLGYSVRWVPNAEAALQEIEKNGIDLVFSDIVMPGRLDGLGLARMRSSKASRPADPAGHRLQRGRAERPRRLSDPAQALSGARTEPRARRTEVCRDRAFGLKQLHPRSSSSARSASPATHRPAASRAACRGR